MNQPSLFTQVLSSLGAALILIAYIGHQVKWKPMDSLRIPYNLLNTAGGVVLAYIALRPLQVGFAVMESTWTVVSVMALYRAFSQPRNQTPGGPAA
jgi:small neutral amino acid transporter SnatA (MarC family)